MGKESLIKEEKEVLEFLQIVDEIYGFYRDTISAFQEFLKSMINAQKFVSEKTNLPVGVLDELAFNYAKDDKEMDKNNFQYSCTQSELKKRINKDGENYKTIANLCIVLIFQYWDYYRKKIAKQLNIEENEIKFDIMGDIRYLRNSILKHKGTGNHEMKKCKILKWFKEGEEININPEQFEKIIRIIKKSLSDFS